MTLDEIGVKNGTDKSSLNHRYLGLYELLFAARVPYYQHILEIGVQFGNSLRTWRDYFHKGAIIGIDVIDNGVYCHVGDRISIIYGDAYTDAMTFKLSHLGNTFDIIIDDGDHIPEHQAFVVANYHKLLSPDGLLIIEDVPSAEAIPILKAALSSKFQYTSVEMTEGDSVVDSRLFIAWRKI